MSLCWSALEKYENWYMSVPLLLCNDAWQVSLGLVRVLLASLDVKGNQAASLLASPQLCGFSFETLGKERL